MTFPLENIPKDHFQGLGHLATDEPDSLRNLLNRLRSASDFGGYQVDQNDDRKYSNIAEAFAVADANEPDGAEIKFTVADGDYSDNINFGDDHPITIEGIGYQTAKITGNLIFGNYAAEKRHVIRYCEVEAGTITIKDGTNIIFDQCIVDKSAFTLNPTDGTVGYRVRLQNCDVQAPTIAETASSTGTRRFVIDGGTVTLTSILGTPISIYSLHLKFLNIAQENLEWSVWLNPLIDFNDNATNVAKVWFSNFAVMNYYVGTSLTEWFTNETNAWVYWDNAEIRGQDDGKTVKLGSPGVTYGGPRIISDVEPVSVPRGTVWVDWRLGDSLLWDGTYWGSSGIYRKDVLVNIGGAALNHDIGFDVPSGGAVVSQSFKLLKTLTGGGGAVQAGLGTGSGGDPDKYAETAALTAGQKDQNLHVTFNDGGGDDLQITAETAPGTAGGTISGSNDKDARVVVYFTLPKTLP